MPSLFALSELGDLIEKVEKGQRLNFDEGVRLINSQEILTLGYMANLIREQKNGNKTRFMTNRLIDYRDILASYEENEKRSTATMIYGNQESKEERIDRLVQIRSLQDQSQEFLTFSPIPFFSETEQFNGNMGVGNTTGYEDLKMLAISRILLDNFNHIKAFWMLLGPKLTQVALAFGVDVLDGRVVEEHETSMAESSQIMSKRALIQLIQKAGREAVESK